MKYHLEKILQTIAQLPDNKRDYIIKQLRGITADYNNKVSQLEKITTKKTGIKQNEYNDYLQLSADILKLHGYKLPELISYSQEFLEWFTKATSEINKYNPKEITKTILDSFNQGYMIFNIEHDRPPADYKELRDFVMNWEDVLNDYHKHKLNTVLHGAD
jgi:hypothetical protein